MIVLRGVTLLIDKAERVAGVVVRAVVQLAVFVMRRGRYRSWRRPQDDAGRGIVTG